MNSNTPIEASALQKGKVTKKNSEYSVKQKLLPSILLSLVIPLSVCFFGPFEIYYANMSEFNYSVMDFLPVCVLAVILISSLTFALLILLRGIAYDVACGVITVLALLLFIQRNFLNMGVDALVGDGVGTYGVDIVSFVINTVIWIVVIVAAVVAVVIVRKKYKELLDTVIVIAMISVIGMQITSMTVLSLTSDVWQRVDERGDLMDVDLGDTDVLTFDGITELSAKNNVVVFIVDRFDSMYYDSLVESEPEFFDRLDGFTYYNDYTSLYSRTYPAVVSILTGYDNDFSVTRPEFFEQVYADGGHLRTMKEKGYDIDLYTKEYYVYENATVMDEYVGNIAEVAGYYIKEPFLLSFDMMKLSFSGYLPFVAKGTMGYMSTPDFNNHAEYILVNSKGGEVILPYDSDLKIVRDHINGSEFEAVNSNGKFTFIHLDGCHTPIRYNGDWEEVWNYDTDTAIKLNFEIIFDYIDEMKALGIYEDSTIVITGDHAWSANDYLLLGESLWGDEEPEEEDNEDVEDDEDRGVRVTSMFFKRSGDAGTKPGTSTAQISQDELWNTIYESEGLLDKKTGLSFFDIPEGVNRERRYMLQVDAKSEINELEEDQVVEYKITGSALDPDNWEVVGRQDVGNMYK